MGGFWNSAELVGHHFMMQSLVLLLVGAVAAQNSAPPPPPDRIWFRQDSLPGGKTCADMYEGLKGTPAVNTGKVTERAGRDWAHDSGKKSTCAEGCCEFQFGSLAKKYIPWFPTTSDCSNTGPAKEAPLYFKSSAGSAAKLCVFLPTKADSAPEWQVWAGTAAGCVGQCCSIKRN